MSSRGRCHSLLETSSPTHTSLSERWPLLEACGPPRPCPQGGEEGRPLLQLPEVDPALQSTELGAQAPQSSCPGLGEVRGEGEKQRGTWAGKSGRLGRKGREGG